MIDASVMEGRLSTESVASGDGSGDGCGGERREGLASSKIGGAHGCGSLYKF